MAKGVHVGDAWVEVNPETKNFYHKIADQLAKQGNREKDQPRVQVRPEIDRDKWQKDFDEAFKRDSDKPKVAVGFDKDHSSLRQDLIKEFRQNKLTVGVRLSESDKLRIGQELKQITEDRYITVRVRARETYDPDFYSKQLQERDKARKKLEQDIDSAVASNYVKPNTVRLELDKEQVYKSLRSLGKFDVPIQLDDSQLNEHMERFYATYFDPNDPWELKLGIEQKSLEKVKAKIDSLAGDKTKTFTVKYRESTDKSSKKALDRFKSLTEGEGLTARVNLVPDEDKLNESLDVPRTITLRPELNNKTTKMVEERLDHLTRPRMVEILTGDTRFSGFAEDLSQALQTAWEDLDPRLTFKDVFEDFDRRDPDEVQKVFVVNQVETMAASGTGAAKRPAPVSVADVATEDPVTVKPDPRSKSKVEAAAGEPPGRPTDFKTWYAEHLQAIKESISGYGREHLYRRDRTMEVPDNFYDRVQYDIMKARARQLTGEPMAIRDAKIAVHRAQIERFAGLDDMAQHRVLWQRGIVDRLEDTLEQFTIPMQQLIGKYGAWKPESPEHLKWMLEHNDLGGGRTLEFLRKAIPAHNSVVPFAGRAKRDTDYADAVSENARLFQRFLAMQERYLKARPLEAVRDKDEVILATLQAWADGWDSVFTAQRNESKRAFVELLDSDRDAALTPEQLERRRFNRARLETDPNFNPVSDRQWRKMTTMPRQRVAFDWDSLHSTDAFSKAVEEMTAPNGRDGTFKFYAKNMAHSVMKPFGKIADMAWGATHSTAKNALSTTAKPFTMSKGIVDATAASGVELTGVAKGSLEHAPIPVMKAAGASDPSKMLTKLGGAASKVVGPLGAVGSVLTAIVGLHTKMGAFGIVLGGLSESILGLGAMGSSVLAPFANSLKGIMFAPALFTSLAAGVGATALAFRGVGAAFTEADAFNDLQENAQGFVRATQDMIPAFSELQNATQQSFFTGWGDAMKQLATTTMPALQRSLPKVAEGFGGLGRTFIETLGRKDVAKNLEGALTAAGDGFQRMRPGIEALTDFWMQVSRVGAETLMPKLGDGFSNLMDKWREWATDDKLSEVFNSAADGLSKVADFTGTAWSGLSNFFKGAAEGADAAFGDGGVWGAMMGKLNQFRDWAGSEDGQSSLANFFQGATESAKEVADIMGTWGEKIITETGPAFRDFIDRYGDDIEDIGSALIDTMTNGMYAIGPIIEMIKGPIEALAKTAELANEAVGGPGSKKAREKMGDNASKIGESISDLYNAKDGEAFIVGGERNLKARQDAQATISGMNVEIAANAEAGLNDPNFDKYVDQLHRLEFAYQGMMGTFQNGHATGEATAAMFKYLGDSIVDISEDDTTLEIKAEGTEQARAALDQLGYTAEELDNGNYEIKFENGMEVQNALQDIRNEMTNMPDVEIEARGLDDLYGKLMEMTGTGYSVTIDVQGEDMEHVKSELEGIRGASVIDGKMHLDTNAPDVQRWLVEIGAAKDVDGTFIMTSNAAQIIAEVLGIPTHTVGEHLISDNADAVSAKVNSIPTSTSGSHTVTDNVAQVEGAISRLQGKNTTSTHTHVIRTVSIGGDGGAVGLGPGGPVAVMNADGSVMRAADGFANRQAGIAKAGSYILWAENETDDESYIPHALSKRKRSTQILVQTANDFGLDVVDGAGNFVTRDGTSVAPTMVTPMADGGTRRAQRLREENRARATAAAHAKVEANKKAKEKPKATAAQKEQLARAEAREKEIEALRDKEYARRLVAIERGNFIYRDTDPEHDDAVLAVDRAGLIPGKVGMRKYIERDENVSMRTLTMLAAMEADGYSLPPEGERLMRQHGHKLPPEVRYRIRHRNELPAHVRRALLTGEQIEDPDAPVDVDAQLNSRDWERAFMHISADPQDRKRWEQARWMVHDETVALGKHVGQSYADEAADIIGLNATKLRDIPLYNLFNPSADAYNELIGSVHTGRRELEGDYRDRYQTENKIRRDAEKALREQQQGLNKDAKKQDKTAEQMAKDIAAQDKRNAESMAQYNAGMKAVQEHRAAQRAATANTTQSRGGLTVNQTIGNITTNSAQDAADRFRRQATVGFENLVGAL